MKVKEIFNYDNIRFSSLRNSARAISKVYREANHWLDEIKEWVYIEYGLPNVSQIVHYLAHTQNERLDTVADLLHERHLMQEYPTVEELDIKAEVKDLDDVFSLVIRILDNIQESLEKFHAVTDNAEFRPMALKVEELMLQNSQDYTKFLEMWTRWDTDGGSKTSFDSWCKRYLDGNN